MVDSSDGGSGSKGVGGVWSTAVMATARALAASGATAAIAMAARGSVASGATTAMVMADGDRSRFEAAHAASLGTAAER